MAEELPFLQLLYNGIEASYWSIYVSNTSSGCTNRALMQHLILASSFAGDRCPAQSHGPRGQGRLAGGTEPEPRQRASRGLLMAKERVRAACSIATPRRRMNNTRIMPAMNPPTCAQTATPPTL